MEPGSGPADAAGSAVPVAGGFRPARIAFHTLLLIPLWAMTAVIRPWIPVIIIAALVALSLMALLGGRFPREDRRLAWVTLVICANLALLAAWISRGNP